MSQKRIQQIEQRMDRIKRALLEIGPMRPGSLTRQYKDPQHHTGAYWQISYTRRMKSRTEYVRPEWVKEIRRQTVIHKRFKRLVDQWIDLSIEHSRLTMQMTESKNLTDRRELGTLNHQQLGDILDSGPVAYGLDNGVWTSPMIAWGIEEKFGVAYHPGHVRKLLHTLGFSVQRPRRVLARANAVEQDRWHRRVYPQIKKRFVRGICG